MQQAEQSLRQKVGERPYRCYMELTRFVDQHGYVPSYAELASTLGVAPATVGRYLFKLQKAGVIERRKNRARSIVIKLAA